MSKPTVCERHGHTYDAERFSGCPECRTTAGGMQVPTVRAAASSALSAPGARTSSGGLQAPAVRSTTMGLQEPTTRNTAAGIAPSLRGRTTAGGMQASTHTTAGGMQAPSRRPSQLETQRPAQAPISLREPTSKRPEGRTTAHGTGSRRPSQMDTQRHIETQRPRFAPIARPASTPPNARVYGAMALGWLVLVGALVQRQWFSDEQDDPARTAAHPPADEDPSAGPPAAPARAPARADQSADEPGEPPRGRRTPQILYRGQPGEVPAICAVPWLEMYGRASSGAASNAAAAPPPAAQTPLMLAASSGAIEDLQRLLDQGAEVDARDALNRTPLIAAAQAGRNTHVQALLLAGADGRARGLWDASGGSLSALDAALQAGKRDTARLIEADTLRTFTTLEGPDLEALDEAGETPLHWVARYADARSAQLLLARGADREARTCPARPGDERGPHQADPHAATPLLLAIWGDNPAVARELLEAHADAHAVDERGRGVFHLMRHQDALALTPALLEAGADPLQPDREGKTALDALAERGLRAELLRALAAAGRPQSTATATLPDLLGLIQRLGSDRKPADPTPVLALLESDSELVRATDARGRSALFEASAQGLAPVAEALASRGARVDARDREGRTPLHLARDGETVKLLLRLGADVNARDAAGDTPLHLHAASPGSLDAVTALIQGGANTRLADQRRRSALDRARASGSPDVVAYLEQF
ncbi:MAG TPA: ankyrin repeat domain-containing protein [Polyangiaceae bacterium]|nr:ankyrin repeat domain-containing protein [Polyangiaceae bacterium]